MPITSLIPSDGPDIGLELTGGVCNRVSAMLPPAMKKSNFYNSIFAL